MTDKRKLGFDASPFTSLDDPNLKLSDAAKEHFAKQKEDEEDVKETDNG